MVFRLLLLLLSVTTICTAQNGRFSIPELVKSLGNPEDLDQQALMEVITYWSNNPGQAVSMLAQIEQAAKKQSDNRDLQLRLQHLRVLNQLVADSARVKLEIVKLYADSMLLMANQWGDDRLLAIANCTYASFMYSYQQLEAAATYWLRGVEYFEKGHPFVGLYGTYCSLGEALYRAKEYKLAIHYTVKGYPELLRQNDVPAASKARFINTIGQAYLRLHMPDSAMHYFRESAAFARTNNDSTWEAINACFEGQVLMEKGQYQEAFKKLQQAYMGIAGKDGPMEMYALLWMGKWYLQQGNTLQAAKNLHAARAVPVAVYSIQQIQVAEYREQIYQTLATLHRKTNQPDSFYYYHNQYSYLHDSLEHVYVRSSMAMLNLRNEANSNQLKMARLLDETERQHRTRNLIVAGIVLAAGLVIFELSRQRKVLRLRQEADRLRKETAEKEVESAREQLALFTQMLQEKGQLIEQLQADGSLQSAESARVLETLSKQVILTEDDWVSFRNTFEKLYPGFFVRLRQAAPDITMAEQRMAALTMLQINGKEIGAILGISPDSVRKTRQRLRQRMQAATDEDLMSRLAVMAAPSV